MLQTYGSNQPALYEDRGQVLGQDRGQGLGQGLGLGHYVGILKKRILYFVIPFSLIVIFGFLFTAMAKPIYLSEGKVLIESQEIPVDLVRPTVTTAAIERIQIIQQRIMTRDNLSSIVSKFGLFSSRQLSGTQLLDLMRERTQIKPVDVPASTRQGTATIAFTLSFEYESPELAMRVANEFLTLILNEDARTRTNRATETTKFLATEVKRLETELDSTQVQISEIKRRPREAVPEMPEQERSQLAMLAALRAELIQKTSVYSDAHPAVTTLKKRIAAMEKTMTQSAQAPATAQATQADDMIGALERQRQAIDRRLDDANSKLAAARLGESLERDQRSERLQVIEQPTLPQKPFKPNKPKMFGIAFALAVMAGVGAIFAAEALDSSIRGSHELLGAVDSQLVVSIPYISTRAEILRIRRRVMLGAGVLVTVLLVGLAAAFVGGLSANLSWFNQLWLDVLTRLSA